MALSNSYMPTESDKIRLLNLESKIQIIANQFVDGT